MRTLIVVTALLFSASALASDVYKWKDAHGNVHYGDKPKQGGEAVDVQPGSGPGESDESVKSRDARSAECEKKKTQLETYRKAPSLSETDNLGKTREYSEAERQQFLALQEKKVAELCAPPSPTAAQ